MLPKIVKIKKVIKENKKVKSFVLDEKINAKPGQFLMVWIPEVDEKPFSISDINPLSITVARVGPFTKEFHKLREGDKVGIRGPFGRGFRLIGKKVLLIGGGYGAAPLRFLAKEAKRKGIDVSVILGAKSADELLFEEEFASPIITTDDGSKGIKGTATKAARKLIKNFECVYACGPEEMLKELGELCNKSNVMFQASLERYIRCGIGICGECAIDGFRICADGPVFLGKKLLKMESFI